MKWFGRKKQRTAAMTHYAPDITLTPMDYIQPLSPQQQLEKAEQRIRAFLKHTDPDSLCEGFYDRIADEERDLTIALLRTQTPDHQDVSQSIVRKHFAELERLDREIRQVELAISTYSAQVADLQEQYDRCNKPEV